MGTRKEAIEEAMLPWLAPDRSPADLPRAFAAGIEAGFAWHEGDDVLAAEGIDVPPVFQGWMQDPTSAEPDAALVERNLRSVLDTVLEYLAMRDGWVPIDLEEHRVREVAVAVMIKGWIERNGAR
jgi:hypothetical protein